MSSSGSTPEIRDYFSDLQTPNIEDMQLQLETLVQQGVITPEQAQAALVGDSAFNGITADPNLKKSQLDALAALQGIGESGGLTDADMANLNRIQTNEQTTARGARDAILQNMEQRGMGSSGMSILAQLQNAQDSATRQSQRDMDIAGLAQQRALDALTQAGTTAGNIRGQDFNEQAQIAGANDAIAKFNAQNTQQVNLANTQANNIAQASNLAEKQRVADANVNTRNQQQQYNKELQQKEFDNQIKKRQGQAGIGSQNAANAGADSQRAAESNNQNLNTALQVGAMAAMAFSDERGKEDIEDFNASDFLDSLTSKKYQYKDKKHGEGAHYGPMAQDLEKTEVGSSMVVDTPEGKMVNGSKAAMAALGSLADINKRLKKIEGEE